VEVDIRKSVPLQVPLCKGTRPQQFRSHL